MDTVKEFRQKRDEAVSFIKNKIGDFKFESKLDGFAIKQPVFSFSKFPNVNKNLGPEMKSTGESILFIDDLKDDDFYEIYSRRKMYLTK